MEARGHWCVCSSNLLHYFGDMVSHLTKYLSVQAVWLAKKTQVSILYHDGL